MVEVSLLESPVDQSEEETQNEKQAPVAYEEIEADVGFKVSEVELSESEQHVTAPRRRVQTQRRP